jgi:hypothetical protein
MDSSLDAKFPCPVCGYYLDLPPWDGQWSSLEICPSCGIQFGNDDDTEGDCTRDRIYQAWRDKWVQDGAPWWAPESRPASWDPGEQLLRIGVDKREHLKLIKRMR